MKGSADTRKNFTESSTLRLLLPWELNYHIETNFTDKKIAKKSLTLLANVISDCLNSINHNNHITQVIYSTSGEKLNEELIYLERHIEYRIAELSETHTSLTTDEVKEYDQYFKIEHIHSKQHFLSLVFSLLHSVFSFINLCHKTERQLSYHTIAQQINGFEVYRKLLVRTGDIECLA